MTDTLGDSFSAIICQISAIASNASSPAGAFNRPELVAILDALRRAADEVECRVAWVDSLGSNGRAA